MRSSPLGLVAIAPLAIACASTPPPTPPTPPLPPAQPRVAADPAPPRAICEPPRGVALAHEVALSMPFDRVTASGKLRLVARADASGGRRVRTIAIADPVSGALLSRRDALPHSVWQSTDGSIQLVWEPGALVRVELETGRRTHVVDASKSSDAEYVDGGDTVGLSDDGRYYVRELEIRDVDAGTIAHVLPNVSAGGPNQRAWFVGETRYVDACMRGCELFDPHGKGRDLAGTPTVTVGPRFDVAPSVGAVLVMPYQPFAVEWSDGLRVCTLDGAPCRPKLTLAIPKGPAGSPTALDDRRDYDAALCPTGDLATVAWQGALRFFDTKTGAERSRVALPAPLATGDAPRVRYAPGSDAIALVRDDTLRWFSPNFQQ